jgi:hypothetical protein
MSTRHWVDQACGNVGLNHLGLGGISNHLGCTPSSARSKRRAQREARANRERERRDALHAGFGSATGPAGPSVQRREGAAGRAYGKRGSRIGWAAKLKTREGETVFFSRIYFQIHFKSNFESV